MEVLKAIDVADWFIVEAKNGWSNKLSQDKTENGEVIEPFTHLKLQKMLYFAQAAHLALYDKPLFRDQIKAWALGPVVPTVYKIFKGYKGKNIANPTGIGFTKIDPAKVGFLKKSMLVFGKLSAYELVDISHRHAIWKNAYESESKIINQEEMRTFYKGVFTDLIKL